MHYPERKRGAARHNAALLPALECVGYFNELIEARRGAPRDDVLSEPIAAEEEGDRLTHDELLINLILLLIAGHETTSNLIGNGSLYKVKPLTETTTQILVGKIPDHEPEPIAWTNLAGPKKARIFNTTLGHLDDFENPAFRKLLTNALYWALEQPYPVGQNIDKLLPVAAK